MNKQTSRSKASLDRKREAEAELAEISLAEKRGELVKVEAVTACWKDGFAKLASVIRNATYLDEKQRNRLLAEFMAVKLEEE